MKTCPTCGRSLDLAAFSSDRSRFDGFSKRCRDCDNTRRSARAARADERRPAKLCRTCSAPLASRRYWYCDTCRAARQDHRSRVREARRRSAQARGYGAAHQRLRREWAKRVESGGVCCTRCGLRIAPGSDWDLGHDDRDRSRYTGPEHRSCNRSAGAVKGNRERGGRVLSEAW